LRRNARYARDALACIEANMLVITVRSEYYGGNDGLKLPSQFFKRVMLQYVSGNSDGMARPGPQISKQNVPMWHVLLTENRWIDLRKTGHIGPTYRQNE
jgi:hypothetical protein